MPAEPHVVTVHGCEVDGSTVDRRIAALAQAGSGVVSRRELLAAGVSPREIQGRTERGVLHPLHRGVYAVGHRVLTRDGRWRSALLAAGPGAALSHRSAAQLWSVGSEGGVIEVAAPSRRRSRPGLRLRESALHADEIDVVRGLQVTTVARTLVDLAAVVRRDALERAVRRAEAQQLADAASVQDLLIRHRGRRGIAGLRAVVGSADLVSLTRSRLEDRFLAFLRRRGLPRPTTNAALLGLEVDCVWWDARVAVELDGYATHGTRTSFETDRRRDRTLLAAGWRVLRVTWRQLHDDPLGLERDLRRLFGLEAHVRTRRG